MYEKTRLNIVSLRSRENVNRSVCKSYKYFSFENLDWEMKKKLVFRFLCTSIIASRYSFFGYLTTYGIRHELFTTCSNVHAWKHEEKEIEREERERKKKF